MRDGVYDFGDAKIRIEGINRVNKALKQSGADMSDMSSLMHKIGMLVVDAAAPPIKTGALAASMRAGTSKNKAVVRAGYAKRVPYARVVHWGWAKKNRPPRPFLSDAEQRQQSAIYQALDLGLADIFKKNNL